MAMINQAQIANGNYLQMTGRLLHLAVLIRGILFDILGFCSLFHFAQEWKRLSMGGLMCHYFLLFLNPFLHHFNYLLVLIVKSIRQFYYLGSFS